MNCLAEHMGRLREIELLAAVAQNFLDDATGRRTSEGRTEANAITRSALVLLCGYFEGFIRELLEEAVEVLNDSSVDITRLPSPLLCSVIEDETATFRKSSTSGLSKLLRLCRSEEPVVLNKSKLAKTGGNPTVDTIEALFDAFGIPDVIDSLSVRDYGVDSTYTMESQVNSGMRRELEQAIELQLGRADGSILNEVVSIVERKWVAKKKRRSVGYINGISELLKRRNRIAHGEGQDPVTPPELLEAKQMVEKLTVGLHDLVENQLRLVTEQAT